MINPIPETWDGVYRWRNAQHDRLTQASCLRRVRVQAASSSAFRKGDAMDAESVRVHIRTGNCKLNVIEL